MNNRDWEVSDGEPVRPSGKTVQDFIYFEGMYNPALRFAFTNVLDEDFVSYWNSQRYIIKPKDTAKLPHHLAVKFTKEIVDKMMLADGKASSMGIPAVRKPYEDRVLSLLPDVSGIELEIIKNEFIDQAKRDTSRKEGVADEPIAPLKLDFEDLGNKIVESEGKKKGKK